MKKLFIVFNIDYSLLSHRKDIAIRAKQAGYDVTIVAKDTGLFGEIAALGLKTIDLPINRSGMNVAEDLKTFKFLFDLYRKEKPDIVHHVGLKTILWGALAAKLARLKSVVCAINGLGVSFAEDNKSMLTKVILRIIRFSFRRKNSVAIFQNTQDRDLFLNEKVVTENQVRIIKGSGVNLSLFNYTPEIESDRIKILFTARMVVDKGIMTLIDAANILKEKYYEKIQLVLCGNIDDNPRAIKEAELIDMCDGEYIKWIGFRSDVIEQLKSCHIVTLPSFYREGLPKSLIEAAAIGRPIVTTDNIGCRDTVEDGENGYIIPIKDSVALANKIELLVNDKSLRDKMGKKSREIAERDFSIENVVEKHLAIYDELITNSN